MKLKVTNTKTGTVHEHENTNHAWGDLAREISQKGVYMIDRLVCGDTERLLTDGKTWYLLDECGNWEYVPDYYKVEGTDRETVLARLDKEIAIREQEMNVKGSLADNVTTASGYFTAAGALNWVRVVLIAAEQTKVVRK